jgi:hypothetical protein
MSNFLIFKAAFNNSATPAIGTYTVEGGTVQFIRNTSLSPDYYMYAATAENPIKWFVPTAVVTDFEFVCDILTRVSNAGYAPYFTIADSNGVTKLRMESQYSNIRFMSDDTHRQSSSVICLTSPTDIGGYNIFHQFRIRIRKLTDSSSSVEVYANDNLVTSGTSPALITCGKISFLGATGAFVTGNTMGIKNAYVYDLSGGDVIDRSVLSGAFTRFIGWAKGIFALKSDIPTVNNGTLTIQQNGTNVQTFTANASTNATANISVPTKTSDLTNDSGFITGVTWNDVSNKPTLATVATSGSYNDLTDKPTIPNPYHPPTFTYDSSTETLTVSNTTATVFNYDSNTETLEVQING